MAHRSRAEPAVPPDKTCVSCGRRIEWRHRWTKSWDGVRFCSAACRRRGVSAQDRELEARMRTLLAARASGTVAESDVDAGGADPEAVRRAARRLVAAGEAVVVQRGTLVDPSTAKGPIALRRP